MENSEDIEKAAEQAARAAYELEIAKDTRQFLSTLDRPEVKRPSRLFFYLTSAAAIFLVLIASVITINVSHNDAAIADKYGINKIVSRTGENLSNSSFIEAVRAYYEQDYERSLEILENLEVPDKKVEDFKDWLTLLLSLQTAGSDSQTFNNQIAKILSDENHEFHLQAQKMNRDLKLFWRSLVIKK